MIPRSEYPRPQFERQGWMNLNGTWQFEIDHGGSGRARGLVEKEQLPAKLLKELKERGKYSILKALMLRI